MAQGPVRLTRRRALAVTAAAAGAAAGGRLVMLHLRAASPLASAAGPNGTWASPLDQPRARAAHLLRRAGFGYTPAELDAAASLSHGDLVDRLLHQAPEPLPPPANPAAHEEVVRSWYRHMATTGAQYPERMALFWHGLLTSDHRKANGLPFVLQQNRLYRELGRGDLRTLLLAITVDPLMMRYLDLDRSNATAPNENYSRELMELFTMGPGNYTETDVREGARALAGLRIQLFDRDGRPLPQPARRGLSVQAYEAQLEQLTAQGATFRGVLDERRRDRGTKTFLGRTGDLRKEDVIDAILDREATATFIAGKALVHFVTPSPSAQLVTRVAAAFRQSRYDITSMMRAILTSDDLTDGTSYRSLVRSPADYMVATMRALGNPSLARQAVTAGSGMDQVLYDPPTVAGWPSNAAWLSSSSALARLNFAQLATAATPHLPDAGEALRDQLDGVAGPGLSEVLTASHTDADRWYALLGSPDFQLK